MESWVYSRKIGDTSRMTQVLSNTKGPGSLPLGSHAGDVTTAFHEGHGFDTNATFHSRHASGGNFANKGWPHHKTSLAISHKDGQESGGSPKMSDSVHGPSGVKSKAGRMK